MHDERPDTYCSHCSLFIKTLMVVVEKDMKVRCALN